MAAFARIAGSLAPINKAALSSAAAKASVPVKAPPLVGGYFLKPAAPPPSITKSLASKSLPITSIYSPTKTITTTVPPSLIASVAKIAQSPAPSLLDIFRPKVTPPSVSRATDINISVLKGPAPEYFERLKAAVSLVPKSAAPSSSPLPTATSPAKEQQQIAILKRFADTLAPASPEPVKAAIAATIAKQLSTPKKAEDVRASEKPPASEKVQEQAPIPQQQFQPYAPPATSQVLASGGGGGGGGGGYYYGDDEVYEEEDEGDESIYEGGTGRYVDEAIEEEPAPEVITALMQAEEPIEEYYEEGPEDVYDEEPETAADFIAQREAEFYADAPADEYGGLIETIQEPTRRPGSALPWWMWAGAAALGVMALTGKKRRA